MRVWERGAIHGACVAVAFMVAACGDTRIEETTIVNDGGAVDVGSLFPGAGARFEPPAKTIQTMVLTKANGGALSGAFGCVANQNRVCRNGRFKNLAPQPQQSDADGVFPIELLPSDSFFRIVRPRPGGADVDVLIPISISSRNATDRIRILVPMVCGQNNDDCVSLEGSGGVVATLSGVILDNNGPVGDALVALSGGTATGGTFTSARTNGRGEFEIQINAGPAVRQALRQASLRVTARGYQPVQRVIDVTQQGLVAGLNIRLNRAAGGPAAEQARTVFSETFELDSPTRLEWVAEGGYVASVANDVTQWQLIDRAQPAIVNQLLGGAEPAVRLAPGDETQGIVPILTGRFSYWYGGLQTGSFIGERDASPTAFDGGRSVAPHSGTLTSPRIDLSGVAPGTPLSVAFDSLWEIESVNPNCSGFDILSVWASVDGGLSFERLARLNPLNDPQTPGIDRAAIPFTSGGFNAPPIIAAQEPIPLDRFAGVSDFRLRFELDTRDALFNGFRGWVIDNIRIATEPGTAPEASSLCGGFDD